MNYTDYVRLNFKKCTKDIIKLTPLCFGVFFILFMLMRFPEISAAGIRSGIDLCLGTLIPTMYPFIVTSALITESEITNRLTAPFGKLTEFLFRLDAKCLSIIIMSLIGGMPIGCKMASELYNNGSISRSQSRRLMLFCFCCGPAFTISYTGIFALSSKSAGIVIYISVVIATIITGILSRFFEEEDFIYRERKEENSNQPLSVSLVKAVSSSTAAMLNICSWVILFSCVTQLIEIMPFNKSSELFLYCTLEVTNAVRLSAGHINLPLIAGIVSFGGICSHCQIMPYIIKVRLKYKYFLVARIVSGALSVIICNLLLEVYPVTYEVFSLGTLPSRNTSVLSVSISVALMFMSGLLLIGDSTVIHLKAKKDHRS